MRLPRLQSGHDFIVVTEAWYHKQAFLQHTLMIETLFLIAILVVSVIIHEVAHGVVANFLGDPTARMAGRLTLNPIPHIDPIGSIFVPLALSLLPGGLIIGWAKPVPYNPYNLRAKRWGPALVAGAGPLVNIVLALLTALALRGAFAFGFSLSPVAASFLSSIVLINLILAFFNLLPVPPLDGSRILTALLPYRYRYLMDSLERYGLFLIIIALLLWGQIASFVFTLTMLLVGG